jgi:hypothetical protein
MKQHIKTHRIELLADAKPGEQPHRLTPYKEEFHWAQEQEHNLTHWEITRHFEKSAEFISLRKSAAVISQKTREFLFTAAFILDFVCPSTKSSLAS